jgi:hypothetical protein
MYTICTNISPKSPVDWNKKIWPIYLLDTSVSKDELLTYDNFNQYNTIQTIQYNTIQYKQYNTNNKIKTIQTIQFNTIQYNTNNAIQTIK